MVSSYQPLLTTTNHSPLEILSAPGEQIWDVASELRCTSSSPGNVQIFPQNNTKHVVATPTINQYKYVYTYVIQSMLNSCLFKEGSSFRVRAINFALEQFLGCSHFGCLYCTLDAMICYDKM
jgi:hypothetical protein